MIASPEHRVDLDGIGQPKQHPASVPVRRKPNFARNNKSSSADALAYNGPACSDLTRKVADSLLGKDGHSIRVGLVPRLSFKHKHVLADSRDMRLVEVRAFDRGIDVPTAEFEVSRHALHATEAAS